MELTYTTLIFAVLCHRCISASVDLWSPLNNRDKALDVPQNELIS